MIKKEDIAWSNPSTKSEKADVMYTENGLYVAAYFSRMLRSRGSYIKVSYNSDLKLINLEPTDQPGPASYKSRYTNTGEILKCRDQLLRGGMPYGVYLVIGDMVFQHVSELDESIKNPQ